MSKLLLILTLCTALVGCDFLEPKSAKEPVARVNDTYLYQEDIQALISENTTKQDSISIVANYIQRWATQQLLIDQANIKYGRNSISIAQAGTGNSWKMRREHFSKIDTASFNNLPMLKI